MEAITQDSVGARGLFIRAIEDGRAAPYGNHTGLPFRVALNGISIYALTRIAILVYN